MRKIMHWMLTAILCICGASIFTSCSNDNSDTLRLREDGSTYTATFQMAKVE